MFRAGQSLHVLETIKNINDICAACLQLHENGETSNMQDMLPIQDKIEIYKILESITMFKYSERTPQLLCSSCSYKLVNIYEFQQMCNKSYFCINNYIHQKDAQSTCKLEIDDVEDVETNIENEQFIDEVMDNNFIEECVENRQKQNLIGMISENPTIDNEGMPSTTDADDITCKLEIEVTKVHGLDSEESIELTASQLSHLDSHSKECLGLANKECHIDKKNCTARNFVCDFCGFTVKSKKSLITHKRTHAGKKRFKCTQCRKMFASLVCLGTHKLMHSTERPFRCELCEKAFKKEHCLTSHMATHTTQQLHVCPICSKGYIYKSRLELHMRQHSNKDDNDKIKIEMDTVEGASDINEGNSFIKIEEPMDLSASQSSRLDNHSKERLGLDKKECHKRTFPRDCNKIYSNKYNLTTPIGLDDLMCDICGSTFRNAEALHAHMRTNHTIKKPFKCTECGKAFAKVGFLINHSLSHNTERPFRCKLCAKTFILEHFLTQHMATHANPLLHVCPICGKDYTYKSVLARHMRKHSSNGDNDKISKESERITTVSPDSGIERMVTMEGDDIINETNVIDHPASASVQLTEHDTHPKEHFGLDIKESCIDEGKSEQ